MGDRLISAAALLFVAVVAWALIGGPYMPEAFDWLRGGIQGHVFNAVSWGALFGYGLWRLSRLD